MLERPKNLSELGAQNRKKITGYGPPLKINVQSFSRILLQFTSRLGKMCINNARSPEMSPLSCLSFAKVAKNK